MKKLNIRFITSLVLISFVITTVLTFPFIFKLKTYYHDSVDNTLWGYTLTSTLESIRSGNLFDPAKSSRSTQFFPFAYSRASIDLNITPTLIFAPLYLLTQNVVLSLNILIFISLMLNYISGFYVINYFIKNKKAALIGSLILTFNPFIYARYHGFIILFPVVFLFAYKAFYRPNLKDSLLFYFFFTLNALATIYFQVYMLFSIPLFILPFIISNLIKRNKEYFKKLLKFSAISIPFIFIILFVDLPYYKFSKTEGLKRTLKESQYFSARITDFLYSSPDNLLYGKFAKQNETTRQPREYDNSFNYADHTLFLNVIPVLLFLSGLILYFLNKAYKREKLLFFGLITILLFSFIMMWGPYISIGQVYYLFPKLPYYYFYKYFPFFQGVRVPTRFELIFYFPFVFFVSFAVKTICEKFNKKCIYIFIGILLLIILENTNINSYNDYSPFHEQILTYKNNKAPFLAFLKNKNTIHFPTYINIQNKFYKELQYLTWGIYTKENFFNSFSYIPPDLIELLGNINNNLNENTYKKLSVMNIDYVIIHKNLYINEVPDKYSFLFNGNTEFLKNAVYNDDNIIIIELSKYNFEINKCDPQKDIGYKLQFTPYALPSQPINVQLTITNNNDCYLFSDQEKRFLKTDILINAQKYNSVFFKVPLLINPYEKTIVYQTINPLPDGYGNLKKGVNQARGKIDSLKITSSAEIFMDEPISDLYGRFMFSKFNSLNPNRLHYIISKANVIKDEGNITINAETVNDGDSIWLPQSDINSVNYSRPVSMVVEFLGLDKSNPYIVKCTKYISTLPGENTEFHCKYNIADEIQKQLKSAKMYMILEPNILLPGDPYYLNIN